MIEQSETINKLALAMLQVQGALDGVAKTATNPHFKKAYANLESVIDTAKPALQAAGLVFTQAPGRIIDGAVEVTTMLIHAQSGEWMRSTLHVPLAKVDPQGVGSSITYGLRYSLMATLGLPSVDDDGEAAMQRNAPSVRAPANDPPPVEVARMLPGDGADKLYARLVQQLNEAAMKNITTLGTVWAENKADIKRLPEPRELDLIDLKEALKAKALAAA